MTAVDERVAVSARRGTVLIGVGVVLVALNLRAGITSMGAVLDRVSAEIGLAGVQAGVLTALPVVAFAVVGACSPVLVRRVGLVGGLVLAGLALVAGQALRVTASSSLPLLAWTALAMAGIAVGNVLLPAVVKQFFPQRLGLMTGLYTMALQLGSAVAAGATSPLSAGPGGWRTGLGAWALLAVCGLLPWLLALRRHSQAGRASGPRGGAVGVARSPLAWSLAVFFGMQSLAAYVIMGWLPEIYRAAGIDADTAGLLLAVVMALAAPVALLLPTLANRLPDQRVLVVTVTAAMAAGWIGLTVAPAAGAWWWAVLLGIGSGAFPLALTMIGLRARTSDATTALSAFAQSVGYVLAIAGPLTIGALHEATGGWRVPLVLLIALLAPQLVAGLLAGRHRYVEDPAPRPS